MPIEKAQAELDPQGEAWRLMFDDSAEATADWIEQYLTVPNEHGQIVPMKLYPQQRRMLEEQTGRDVTIKGRQTRASSVIMARTIRRMTTGQVWGATCVMGAQDDQTTENGFRARILHHLKNDLSNKGFKFDIPINNPNELVIGGLENRFIFISGEQRTMSRGYSVQIMHLSEFAHWKKTAANLLGGAIPAVPSYPYGWIDLESTPNGEEGEFYDRAQKSRPLNPNGLWTAHLYPWWLEPRYRVSHDYLTGADIIIAGRELAQYLNDFSPTDHEARLMAENNLVPEQMLWRRFKKEELDSTPTPFLQEYPEDMDTCWLGVQGRFFDTNDGIDHLEPYRDMRRGPLKFLESLVFKGDNVSFQGHNLAIWEFPDQNDSYVLSFDTAGGGIGKDSDWSVAYVWSAKKEKIVARLRVQVSPKRFAAMLCALAAYFKNALVTGERSHHGAVVFEEMRDLMYTNIYYHVDPFKGLAKHQRAEPGVYPTEKTRQQVLEKFKAGITNHAAVFYDAELMREMNTFTWQKVANRLKAAADTAGQHDDCIMAAAHGWFILDKARVKFGVQQQQEQEVIAYGPLGRVIRRGLAGEDVPRREQIWNY